MTGNPLLNRVIRQTLYSLKRQYGAKVSVYKTESSNVDYETGTLTKTKSSIDVQKCIVMPMTTARALVQSAAYLKASNSFAWKGQNWSKGERAFIFEGRDLRGYEWSIEDWIVYRNQKYEIKEIEELEFNTGWLVTAQRVEGVDPEEFVRLNVSNTLATDQEVSNG